MIESNLQIQARAARAEAARLTAKVKLSEKAARAAKLKARAAKEEQKRAKRAAKSARKEAKKHKQEFATLLAAQTAALEKAAQAERKAARSKTKAVAPVRLGNGHGSVQKVRRSGAARVQPGGPEGVLLSEGAIVQQAAESAPLESSPEAPISEPGTEPPPETRA
jgi:hypothetical protein